MNCNEAKQAIDLKNLTLEVENHIKTCPSCQVHHHLSHPQSTSPHPTPLAYKEHMVKAAIQTAKDRKRKKNRIEAWLFVLFAFIWINLLGSLTIQFEQFIYVYVGIVSAMVPFFILQLKRKEAIQ